MRRAFTTTTAAVALAVGAGLASAPAQAQDKWLGQIVVMGTNFCPRGSAETNGQLLPISQNTALFALLGTTYGGDGRTTFALPDLRGRLEMHVGNGPGLTPRSQGERTGLESTTLLVTNMPAHTHNPQMRVSDAAASQRNPINAYFGTTQNAVFAATTPTGDLMAADAIQSNTVGSGTPFSTVQPVVALRYCIYLQGVFPPRP